MAIGKDDSAAFAGQSVGGWPSLTFHPTTPEGVWAVVDRDYGESITVVYRTEVEALRVLNGRGYGRVRYVPFGSTLNDLDNEETRLKQLRDQLASSTASPDVVTTSEESP